MAETITLEKSEIMVCYVTCPNDEVATKIAGHLVSNKLAACCNIVSGVKSVYEWEGKICTDQEQMMIIKTHRQTFDKMASAV